MIYRIVEECPFPTHESGKNTVSYQVYDGEKLAAEFAFHIQVLRGEEVRRFWIDGIRLCDEYADSPTMESILQFVQYKCAAGGCPAMHVRLDNRNLFYLELYRKYGFYMLDQEESKLPGGQVCCISVLKYPLPGSRDDVFRGYILRTERKKAGKSPERSVGGK